MGIEHVALQNTIDYHKSTISWGISTKWPSKKKRSRDYLQLRALQTVRSIWTTQNHAKEVLVCACVCVWNVSPGVETSQHFGLCSPRNATHTKHEQSSNRFSRTATFLVDFSAWNYFNNKNQDALRRCLPNYVWPLRSDDSNNNSSISNETRKKRNETKLTKEIWQECSAVWCTSPDHFRP